MSVVLFPDDGFPTSPIRGSLGIVTSDDTELLKFDAPKRLRLFPKNIKVGLSNGGAASSFLGNHYLWAKGHPQLLIPNTQSLLRLLDHHHAISFTISLTVCFTNS